MPLKRILDVYAEKSGFKKALEAAGQYNERQVHEALLTIDSPDFGPMYTRLTLSRRGEIVSVVAGSAPVKDYDRYKKIFGLAAVTFAPVGK